MEFYPLLRVDTLINESFFSTIITIFSSSFVWRVRVKIRSYVRIEINLFESCKQLYQSAIFEAMKALLNFFHCNGF
jgi:hypothetical protein